MSSSKFQCHVENVNVQELSSEIQCSAVNFNVMEGSVKEQRSVSRSGGQWPEVKFSVK